MPWDDKDDLDFILSPSEDEEKAQKEAAADPRSTRMRSNADDILDAVAGHEPQRIDKTLCPLCGGNTKIRGPGVGAGVRSRKCRKCGHEYAIGMISSRAAPTRLPPRIPQIGPFLGEGGPPLDPNQPVQRRIAEHIRRIKDNEP